MVPYVLGINSIVVIHWNGHAVSMSHGLINDRTTEQNVELVQGRIATYEISQIASFAERRYSSTT